MTEAAEHLLAIWTAVYDDRLACGDCDRLASYKADAAVAQERGAMRTKGRGR